MGIFGGCSIFRPRTIKTQGCYPSKLQEVSSRTSSSKEYKIPSPFSRDFSSRLNKNGEVEVCFNLKRGDTRHISWTKNNGWYNKNESAFYVGSFDVFGARYNYQRTNSPDFRRVSITFDKEEKFKNFKIQINGENHEVDIESLQKGNLENLRVPGPPSIEHGEKASREPAHSSPSDKPVVVDSSQETSEQTKQTTSPHFTARKRCDGKVELEIETAEKIKPVMNWKLSDKIEARFSLCRGRYNVKCGGGRYRYSSSGNYSVQPRGLFLNPNQRVLGTDSRKTSIVLDTHVEDFSLELNGQIYKIDPSSIDSNTKETLVAGDNSYLRLENDTHLAPVYIVSTVAPSWTPAPAVPKTEDSFHTETDDTPALDLPPPPLERQVQGVFDEEADVDEISALNPTDSSPSFAPGEPIPLLDPNTFLPDDKETRRDEPQDLKEDTSDATEEGNWAQQEQEVLPSFSTGESSPAATPTTQKKPPVAEAVLDEEQPLSPSPRLSELSPDLAHEELKLFLSDLKDYYTIAKREDIIPQVLYDPACSILSFSSIENNTGLLFEGKNAQGDLLRSAFIFESERDPRIGRMLQSFSRLEASPSERVLCQVQEDFDNTDPFVRGIIAYVKYQNGRITIVPNILTLEEETLAKTDGPNSENEEIWQASSNDRLILKENGWFAVEGEEMRINSDFKLEKKQQ